MFCNFNTILLCKIVASTPKVSNNTIFRWKIVASKAKLSIRRLRRVAKGLCPLDIYSGETLSLQIHRSYDFPLENHIKEHVDVVEIFRPSEEALQVVREAVKIKPKVI